MSASRTTRFALCLISISWTAAACGESSDDSEWVRPVKDGGTDAAPEASPEADASAGSDGQAGAAGAAGQAGSSGEGGGGGNGEGGSTPPPEPTCASNALTGDYCGGDKVDNADSNTLYTCNGPGAATVKEVCSAGCVVAPAGEDDYCKTDITAVCNGDKSLSAPSSCPGSTTSELSPTGFYSTSWFGCYRKGDGTIYKDPYDNCEFACGNKGLCDSSLSGPECEAELKWFSADADRFGCGARIRVTNCDNGRSLVLVALDRGPNCGSVEEPCGAATLDMSHPAMEYLFEGAGYYGCSDHQAVHVEKVEDSTPLGP